MSGNKINTKTKGKDDRSKSIRGGTQTCEDGEDLDFALLRKPIPTNITGLAQARKIFDVATEELQGLLSTECDLLYECKVCRNIFRSLVNFISHKRVYCKNKFKSSVHGHFVNSSSIAKEIQSIKNIEESYQASLKETKESHLSDDELDDRIPMTKDLTAIVENINRLRGVKNDVLDQQQMLLQKIPTSAVAVFQNINMGRNTDNMKAEVKEINNILSRDQATLQKDGKFKIQKSGEVESESVIQISDDEDNDSTFTPTCKICNAVFSTRKTLRFHMKYKHVESRLVYPCPDCLEIFSTSWSVYRHLFKVHRKSAAQIRRLRESIQAKAFKMNNPPAFYEKRKNNMKQAAAQKISEEERIDQENQAWMDNMEGDGEVPRCGGCGRTFERRAALAAHTQTCQSRSRALARKPETKKIEIQIRKDYNKTPSLLKAPEVSEKPVTEEISPEKSDQSTHDLEEATMDVDFNDGAETEDKTPENNEDDIKPIIHLPLSLQTEKNNMNAFKQLMQNNVDLEKLICKKCDVKYDGLQRLYEHMAEHYKWLRYACKLCNYKNYSFEKLPEHVRIVHKLKGDSDFYYSTVKALSGAEALELSESIDEQPDPDTSPISRRPSRCSSDSSRFSDDSSSSNAKSDIANKKRNSKQNKGVKRKRESIVNEDLKDGDSKTFEENSSDIDDIEEKNAKKQSMDDKLTSQRPVRKRTKRKNEDFEYDLSNLLKMEAQGYRDSQKDIPAPPQPQKPAYTIKKKNLELINQNLNKKCYGAMVTLSKKAVEKGTAHLKTACPATYVSSKEQRTSNIFVRPMLPKIIQKQEKLSPTKEAITDNSTALLKNSENFPKPANIIKEFERGSNYGKISIVGNLMKDSKPIIADNTNYKDTVVINDTEKQMEKVKSKLNVVPINLRRQSLDLIKNPLINKNIKDFSKVGMKTKILVIKPINRTSKEGTQTIKNPLKFQTIKLKDPNKDIHQKDGRSDQVVVVKVPNVESIPRKEPCVNNLDKLENSPRKKSVVNNLDKLEIDPRIESVVNKMDKLENKQSELNGEKTDVELDTNSKVDCEEAKLESNNVDLPETDNEILNENLVSSKIKSPVKLETPLPEFTEDQLLEETESEINDSEPVQEVKSEPVNSDDDSVTEKSL